MENSNEKLSEDIAKQTSSPPFVENSAGKTSGGNLPEKPKEENAFLKYLPEILSGISSMGGSYMLWGKPLQDKMDVLSRQVTELKEEIRDVKQENKHLQKEIERMQQRQNDPYSGEYLPTKRNSSFPPLRRV